MKWREPWRNTLRRQEPWRLFTRAHLLSVAIWTAFLLGLAAFSTYSTETPLANFAARAWVAPLFGIFLTLVPSFGHWLCPLSVSSGPAGIVRSKGEVHALIPWNTIRSYQFVDLEGERILELEVDYSFVPEQLYLSPKVDVATIELELRAHVSPNNQPLPKPT